jgi:organic radical activating enzyme
MLYNLEYLCGLLQNAGVRTFLETSGSQPVSGNWDWICVSPKKDMPPLQELLTMAHELKSIIHDETDFSWAEENATRVSAGCQLYLQPEWSRHAVMMPVIIEYIKQHPRWKISLQSHKYMHIP